MPEAMSVESRPRLAAKVRLRYDRKAERYMLLYPERGLVLNGTAADVAQLCTGEHTVRAIVEQLAVKYGQAADVVEREVLGFLTAMADRGLVRDGTPGESQLTRAFAPSHGGSAMRHRRLIVLIVTVLGAPSPSARWPRPSSRRRPGSRAGRRSRPPHRWRPSPRRRRPTPAAQIPVDKLKLPPGFKISVWADGIHNARTMAWGSKGTLFLGSRVAGNVYAVVDRGGTREVKVIAKGLTQPSGLAFKDGTLYVAEIPRLLKFENIEASLDSPPAPKVVYDYPKEAHHNWRYLAFGPDGKLYFNMGAPCNICMPPDTHANISSVNPDGTGFEYVRVRRAQQRRLRLPPRDQGALLHQPRPRLGWGTTSPNDTLHHAPRSGPALRLPVLPPGRRARPRLRQGAVVQRVRAAAAEARAPRGRHRHPVLHGRHVPAAVQERGLRRAQGLLEPHARRAATRS